MNSKEEMQFIKENDLDACRECDNPSRQHNEIHIARNLNDESSISCADCGLSWLACVPLDPIIEKLNEARKSHTSVTVILKNKIVLQGTIDSLPDGETWYLSELNKLHDVSTAVVEKSFSVADVESVE